ncbi:hypothetical protein C8Q74DRAFT_1218347 [Fomes fomentarius]|nr:hypothetical protein C8Q74DRAFT_1218347 [Fomes fomentarius]
MADPTSLLWKAPESWNEVMVADPMLDPSPRSEHTVPMEGPSRFVVVDEYPPTHAGSSLVHSARPNTWSFLTGKVHAEYRRVLDSAGGTDAAAVNATEALNVLRLLWTGLLAILLPPAIVVAAALAAAGVILYGCGHVLEGVGRGLTIGSERLWRRVSAAPQTKKLVKVVQAGWQGAQQASSDVEQGGITL